MDANKLNVSDLRQKIDKFLFRDLHPKILIGTASDRYSGWIGQIYTQALYEGRINRRSKKVKGKPFTEETLPVDSLEEYFQHFPVLEIDYTFYSPLLDKDLKPLNNYHVLKSYKKYMRGGDFVVLKVPQVIFAQKFYRGGKYVENETYLDPDVFKSRFYDPANEILGGNMKAMIFEQEYQRKQDRVPVQQMADDLGRFFDSIPRDNRYHLELRTEAYLKPPVFDVLKKYGVGQVLSHWTWLSPLTKQLAVSGGRAFNSGGQRIVRLLTPIGMRYEESYEKAYPFDKLVDGMLPEQTLKETAEIMKIAVQDDIETIVLVNNRAGGNAPEIAQKIAGQFEEINH